MDSPTQPRSDYSGDGSTHQFPGEDLGSERLFETYNKMRNDLKLGLKAFETHNQVLFSELNSLRQEVELLRRKRELQKNSLVELQIRAEKLDQAKHLAIEECLKVKQQDLETLNEQYVAVQEIHLYLSETLGKLKELLELDKKTVVKFISALRDGHRSQLKVSAEYKEKTETMFSEYCTRIQIAIESESKAEMELNEAIQQYRNDASAKDKYQHELFEKCRNKKLMENEVDLLKEKLQDHERAMAEMNDANDELKQELMKNRLTQSAETERKREELDKQIEQIEFKSTELKFEESKHAKVMDEHESLKEQMRDESQKDKIADELNSLSAQIDNLTATISEDEAKLEKLEQQVFAVGGVKQMEKEFDEKKNAIEEKLTENKAFALDWVNKLSTLKEKHENLSQEFERLKIWEEEAKNQNELLKKDLKDLLGGFNDVKTSVKLSKLADESRILEVKNAGLMEQHDHIQQILFTLSNEIVKWEEENALLERDMQVACERNQRATERFQQTEEECHKLDELKRKISEERAELKKLKTTKEFAVVVDKLRNELKQVEQEIEAERSRQATEKEAVETNFNQAVATLHEQLEQTKQSAVQDTAKEQAKIDKLVESLAPLDNELTSCKSELVSTIEKNIAMMKERLQLIRRLTNTFKTLQARVQSNPKDFTVVRMLGTIEEHLESSFRGMSQFLRVAPTDFSSPTYSQYRRTLNAFESKFKKMTAAKNVLWTDPVYNEQLKNAAFALFGLNRYTEVMVGSESTIFSPPSS